MDSQHQGGMQQVTLIIALLSSGACSDIVHSRCHCHESEWYVPWSSQKFDVQCIRPMHAAGSKERSFEVGGLYK